MSNTISRFGELVVTQIVAIKSASTKVNTRYGFGGEPRTRGGTGYQDTIWGSRSIMTPLKLFACKD